MPKNKNDFNITQSDPLQDFYDYTDPNRSLSFRETFIRAASHFFSKDRIAQLFNISSYNLDILCKKEFGQTADLIISQIQLRSDLDCRQTLKRLSIDGNNTAINIYTTYIDPIQKQEQNKNLTIKVVADLDADDNNDGGVRISNDCNNE